jgi:hypothetical protein
MIAAFPWLRFTLCGTALLTAWNVEGVAVLLRTVAEMLH